MSHHIANNDPKKPCKPDIPLVGKHNITPKDLEHGGCGCHPQDLSPSRLDQVIAQYEAMTKEAEAARDEFYRKARNLDIRECTKKQVEQLFDGDMYDDDHMWLPSMDIDEQGYVALNIVVDNEGYAHFVND